MIYEEIPVQVQGSEPYARVQCYIWSWSEEIDIDDRPLLLVIPGGGYHLTTDREAEPVALHFMALGFHVAVLRYSVAPTGWPISLYEVAKALQLLKQQAGAWHIDMGRVTLMGFSAGGHLAASYAIYWKELKTQKGRPGQEKGGSLPGSGAKGSSSHCGSNDCQKDATVQSDVTGDVIRPAGLILGYPVISADPSIWHEGSIRHLLGDHFEDSGLRDRVSLEKHVNDNVPPVFIWNTKTDDTVPAANSEVFVKALQQQNIPVEYHEYPSGGHGLSLANELSDNRQHWCYWEPCQNWVDYAAAWLQKNDLAVQRV